MGLVSGVGFACCVLRTDAACCRYWDYEMAVSLWLLEPACEVSQLPEHLRAVVKVASRLPMPSSSLREVSRL